MILGLFTGLLSSGGIQRASQQVALVLSALARKTGERCVFLSLNDPAGNHAMVVAGEVVRLRGFGLDKVGFLRAALWFGIYGRLIYLSHVNFAPIGLLIRLLRPSSRYIVAGHGTEVWDRLSILGRLGLRYSFLVTAPSMFTANRMIKAHNVNRQKVHVLPWALDPSLLSDGLAEAKPNGSGGMVLLTVGRMDAAERQKGIDAVIQALPSVMQVFPDVQYVVVGEGDDRPRLERLARDSGVAHAINFAGVVSDRDLVNHYRACDIFVMPSRQEGFGLVFLEAMAFGKPVVGCNDGGIPEVVLNGKTGFLVEYGNVANLAERLLLLLGDNELKQRMGKAGQNHVECNYKFETFSRGLNRLLAE